VPQTPPIPQRTVALSPPVTHRFPRRGINICAMSGRTMARIGLRMMPPFPWSPLSSVQRVFPSTAGRSVDQTVHLPVVYEEISYRAVGIRPSCTSLPVASYPRSESGDAVR
jgi:hypothetical protein